MKLVLFSDLHLDSAFSWMFGAPGAARRRRQALRDTLLAALARMRDSDWASHAALLQRRYVEDRSVYHLQQVYNLSERSIY